MKRIRCPKCDSYITFDDKRYVPGQTLVFECPACKKQFKIRIKGSAEALDSGEEKQPVGMLIVVENVFHFRQEIPLYEGENKIGRYVKGNSINAAIETVDPSIDTFHCVIDVKRSRMGNLKFLLRDAPSNTGTFYMNELLRDTDRVSLEDGAIITIGATTLILQTNLEKD